MMTHEDLGSLRCGVGAQEHAIGQVLLLPHGSTRSSLGEKKMVTFRQLGDLFGFTMERNLWNIKEDELQRVGLQSLRGTLPQGQGCSDQEPCA
ncbi:unnamed protein product [Microthlaspi erraticum]|uniref:Uncharacterized protein n=1 Tax=Microthlaspi erraticum TaxID=1685480 RepID=A0A6D2JGE0_9BRAS|nr:unnamed protein product [Microthlaspi erraticum]